MVWLLRRCVSCGRYTLATDQCPTCSGALRTPHPPRFSVDDKYRLYRRRLREIAESEADDHKGKDAG